MCLHSQFIEYFDDNFIIFPTNNGLLSLFIQVFVPFLWRAFDFCITYHIYPNLQFILIGHWVGQYGFLLVRVNISDICSEEEVWREEKPKF